ncbi:hypothetical protein [Paenibacillus tundrae]|uniref:hypothetical protein n=1 Tax=Paenibacillus tundrae TaxID=528187 RepID=UPI0030CB0FC9
MNHRFKTPLTVYRVGNKRDDNNLFDVREPGQSTTLKCHLIKTEISDKTDTKPVMYIIKKTIGVPKSADVQISDEIVLSGRRYLVIDANPRRYWMELLASCEVKGNDR